MTATPIARASDPGTSHAGATAVQPRRGTQKFRILEAYYLERQDGGWYMTGLTADEAAEAAGLTHVGYWKRVSDLLTEGLLQPVHLPDTPDVDVTRPGRSGSLQRVLTISQAGIRAVEAAQRSRGQA